MKEMFQKLQSLITTVLSIRPIILIPLLVLSGDLALIVADQLVGAERGVMFSYQLSSLILVSNAIIVGSALLFWLIKYFIVTRNGRVALIALIVLVNAVLTTGYLLGYRVFNAVVIINFAFLLFIWIAALIRKSKLARNIGTSLISILITLVVVEVIFFVIIKITTKPGIYSYYSNDDRLYRTDSILGYSLNKNATGKLDKILVNPFEKDTSFVFQTVAHSDSIGNRVVNTPGMERRDKYAVFLGCSFTFGLGVEDDETLPYYFSTYDTSYCVYNFGVGGYGPQNVLARLSNQNIRKSIQQDSGICIYTYIQNHVRRAIGDMATYTSWAKDLPYYDYDGDSLVWLGSFSRDRWITSGFYSMMSKSHFAQYFKLNFPAQLSEKHYKLTCDIIRQSREEYKRQFNNDEFYVVIFPDNLDKPVKECLQGYGVKVIDLNDLFTPERVASLDSASVKDQYYIPYDGHPTPLANSLVAKRLADELRAFKNNN